MVPRPLLPLLAAAMLEAALVPNNGTSPAMIGNRANHFSYQPTPGEVDPQEQAAGLRPSYTQQQATDLRLEQLDQALLREEGIATNSVPDMKPR